MPYVIPGRTGTKLEVEDLAILHRKYKNVRSVKEATGDLERMAKTRTLLGEEFDILSGDDDKTFEMMTRNDIRASGVVSVMSNIVPGSIGVSRVMLIHPPRDHLNSPLSMPWTRCLLWAMNSLFCRQLSGCSARLFLKTHFRG